jgi:hypothetical protein
LNCFAGPRYCSHRVADLCIKALLQDLQSVVEDSMVDHVGVADVS